MSYLPLLSEDFTQGWEPNDSNARLKGQRRAAFPIAGRRGATDLREKRGGSPADVGLVLYYNMP